MKKIGGVWISGVNKMSVELDDGNGVKEFELKRNQERQGKQPDWKGVDSAGWEKKTKTGKRMISLDLTGEKFVAFINDYKTTPTDPDFNIVPPMPMKDPRGV